MQVRIPQLFEEIAANKPHGLQIESALQGSRHNCYAGDDNTRINEHQSVGFRGQFQNTPKALANFSPGFELARTLGLIFTGAMNPERVRQPRNPFRV